MRPSSHLLRTLAAVSPRTRVVDLASGHAGALAQLGFDLWVVLPDPDSVRAARAEVADVLGRQEAERRVTQAPPDAVGHPDASADWVVLRATESDAAALREAARVLRPGGWVWVETGAGADLLGAARACGLAVAEAPAADDDRVTVHAIFRRPGAVA